MTVQELASKYRLKTRLDSDGQTMVPGKGGEIYQYSSEESSETMLGVLLITPATKPARTKFWNAMRGKMADSGMTLNQNGEAEGSFLFTGEDSAQVKLAMKLAGIRPKRTMSPEQLVHLRKIGTPWRRKG